MKSRNVKYGYGKVTVFLADPRQQKGKRTSWRCPLTTAGNGAIDGARELSTKTSRNNGCS
jgi:hypothetical protein